MSASSCSAPTARNRRCASSPRAARRRPSCWPAATPRPARRARAASSRCARPPAAMRMLGPNTIGLVNLTDGIMLSATGALEMDGLPPGRIGVVSQSGGILGSLLSRAADSRHRLLQAGLDQQRGRPRHRRLHRAPAGRRRHRGHRALHGRAAPAGGVPRRRAAGRARRQAHRRLQDRAVGSGRPRRRVAYRRDGRRGPDVRRLVPPARRHPRRDLRRPARHPRRAGLRPARRRAAGGDPDLDRRRRHAGRRCLRPGRLRDAAAGCRDHRRRCARCRTGGQAAARPQPDRRDAGRPAAGAVPQRDQRPAGQPELRRAGHHRRLVRRWRSPTWWPMPWWNARRAATSRCWPMSARMRRTSSGC